MKKDLVLFDDISELLTLAGVAKRDCRQVSEADLGFIPKAALVVEAGRVLWAGPRRRVPLEFAKRVRREVSLGGRQVIPGFVECHTHLVFAGNRADEFELRNQGVSYQEIAARGGGILSTMRATRKASTQSLAELAEGRVREFVRQGVTTLEAKSGYALDQKNEFKTLRVHAELSGPRIVSTFLGAHALPPEFSNAEDYLRELATWLPQIRKQKLASRVDIWIEKGFFEGESARRYLQTAKDLGFDLAVHGDQLTLSGGTDLAVELGARSVDHVIRVGDSQISRLAKSETTAVLLPAADLYMKCAFPPARQMIDAGVRVALATDFNPGSCPTQDLSLVGLLARLEMKMTRAEVLAAMTFGGAAALGLADQIGTLSVGKRADFSVLAEEWSELFYSIGRHPVHSVYRDGKSVSF